jgi:hypothetical protein
MAIESSKRLKAEDPGADRRQAVIDAIKVIRAESNEKIA